MSEAHDGPTVVVVTPGEGSQGEGETSGDVQAAVEVAAVEEVADAAVEIAQIEADRDVTLAIINAETTEAIVEASQDEELQRCRTELARLEGENTALRTELTLLTPPLSEEPPPSPSASTEAETEGGSIQTTGAEPVEVVAVVEEAAEPPSPRRKPHKWI